MLSLLRLNEDDLNPNDGASNLKSATNPMIATVSAAIKKRILMVEESAVTEQLAGASIVQRADDWANENSVAGRTVAYEKRGKNIDSKVALIKSPGIKEWDRFTVPMSMREVEPGVKLQMNIGNVASGPDWKTRPKQTDADGDETA
jgi:hypothetical protein